MKTQSVLIETSDPFFDTDVGASEHDRLSVIAANLEKINKRKKHAEALFHSLETIYLQSAETDKHREDIEIFNCVVKNENIRFPISNLYKADIEQMFFMLGTSTYNVKVKFHDLLERTTKPNGIFHKCSDRLRNHICLDIMTVIERLKKYKIS